MKVTQTSAQEAPLNQEADTVCCVPRTFLPTGIQPASLKSMPLLSGSTQMSWEIFRGIKQQRWEHFKDEA